MERCLHAEFSEKRSQGLKVKGWWFQNRAAQLFCELYPHKVAEDGEILFLASMHWFEQFQDRFSISLRSTTNRTQEQPVEKEGLVHDFHRRVGKASHFEPCNVANMDQTPLPFDLNNGETYADKGSSTV